MPLSILSPHSNTLPNVVAALSVLASGAGLTALIIPRTGVEAFGLKPTANEEGSKLAEALTRVYGIRNLAMGVTTLSIWYFGRSTIGPVRAAWRQALGLIFILGVGTPIVDGWVCKTQAGKGQWNHWAFAPVSGLVGAALLGWFDALE